MVTARLALTAYDLELNPNLRATLPDVAPSIQTPSGGLVWSSCLPQCLSESQYSLPDPDKRHENVVVHARGSSSELYMSCREMTKGYTVSCHSKV